MSVFTLSFGWIIEGPMLYFSVTNLHDHTASFIPAFDEICWVGFGEMNILWRHLQVGPNSIEAKLHICSGKTEWKIGVNFFSVDNPFVHSPKVTIR